MITVDDLSPDPPTPEHRRDGLERWRRGMPRQTVTGIWFYPLDPRADEIEPYDIAHHLSMICRWGGASSRFYSVAEHSVIVSLYVDPEYAREALLHDATEAYLGDIVRPLKSSPEFAGYCRLEDRMHGVIAERFNLRTDAAAHAAVKEIDNRVILDEADALLQHRHAYDDCGFGAPLGTTIAGLSPGAARSMFLMRFAELFSEELSRARKMVEP